MLLAAIAFYCMVLSVHDGDTVKIRCPIWPGIVIEDDLRVRGVDAPEINGQCEREKVLAQGAKSLAENHLRDIEISNISRDKYGRVLADVNVEIDGVKVNWAAYLIGRGLGRIYHGEARESWCNSS